MVIINADDFGMNESCSRAIAKAFDSELVTDTTMMANGEFFDEALALAKEHGFFDKIGVHLNLTQGKPLTEGIKSLPEFVKNGAFHKNRDMTLTLSPELQKAVYAELYAQIKRLQNAGICITHADSHHYVHTTLPILETAARACLDCGINKLRLCLNLGQIKDKTQADEINERLRSLGFLTTDFFIKLAFVEESELPDNTEILVHPDFDRNGVLIDRRRNEDGFPTGEKIPKLKNRLRFPLGSYKAI